jgi:hypothetical protein
MAVVAEHRLTREEEGAGLYRRRACRGALLRHEGYPSHLSCRYGGWPRHARACREDVDGPAGKRCCGPAGT